MVTNFKYHQNQTIYSDSDLILAKHRHSCYTLLLELTTFSVWREGGGFLSNNYLGQTKIEINQTC